MSNDAESLPNAAPDPTAQRFDRDGETVYNLALRITGSPGAAWHAAVAAFAAVAERIPPGAPPGTDEQDLLLMGCWHARQMLSQLEQNPEYAAQLRAHDEANVPMASLQASVVKANGQLPVDQREVLALRGLSRLDHQDLAVLLRADPGVLAAMLAQARLMLRDAIRGSQIAPEAASTSDDRQAVALAALRQDGQLRGAEARLVLARWLENDESRRAIVDALEEAGLSYRAWARAPAPDGLREASVAAAAEVAAPTPTPATETSQPEAIPAGEHDRPVGDALPPGGPEPAAVDPAPSAAVPVDPGAPLGAEGVDPDATQEWSQSDVEAMGLGAEAEPGEGWEDEWDPATGEEHLEPLRPAGLQERPRYPRWQIAVVAILLVALIIALALVFLQKDSPTTPTPGPATTSTPSKSTSPKKKSRSTKTTGSGTQGALPAGRASVVGATIVLPSR